MDRLLETKLHIPFWHPDSIVRDRLLTRLHMGFKRRHKLTLVSAPAGYGKTTLMAEWLSQTDPPMQSLGRTWLSLDADDNDPIRFLGYWLAAFQRVDDSLVQSAQSLLDTSRSPPIPIVLDNLLNDLATHTDPIVFVLDDYHTITNPLIHETLEYFVEYQPTQIHLAITTREDPPLPLARMRARGQLTEIRARDLRFTLEEASQFFRHSMHLDLDTKTIDTLEMRTEGWAAGLQLAALAMQHLADHQRFMTDFSGSHRYVIDYLAEEVIHQQDEETQRFLRQTAPLDRFNAALCNTLTGRQDSQVRLQELEEANLFLVPLDAERKWYRYHHLFADYLRAGLEPDEKASLYQQASTWHQAKGQIFESVRYAFASGDMDFAAEMVGHAIKQEAAWSTGRMTTLLGWLEALPTPAFQNDPLASLHASRILYLSGRFERAEALIDQAERVLHNDAPTIETQRLLALAALYRGGIASIRGEIKYAIEQSRYAQVHLPRKDRFALARAAYSLGLAHELSGATEQAVEHYLVSSSLAHLAGVLFLAINARCAAASTQIVQGKLGTAAQTCQQAIDMAGAPPIPPVGLALSILGQVALERDDLPTAEKYLLEGIELSQRGGLQDDLSQGLVIRASLEYAQGDLDSALATIEQGTAIVDAYRVPRVVMLPAAYRARFQLAAGHVADALEWARQYQKTRSAQSVEYLREFEDLTLARVLLASGEPKAASEIVDSVLAQAQATGRMRVCIEALVVQTLCYRAEKNTPAALDSLTQALQLAVPKGFIRLFVDEGQPLFELLSQVRPAVPDLLGKLFEKDLFDKQAVPALTVQLPEPLTDQERRVLGLLGLGMTNREIADELVISVGTAKWHVHNVLQKLDVDNRAQAVVRARELGIV